MGVRRSIGRTVGMLGVACVMSACGGDREGTTPEPPPDGGTTIASATMSGEIVSVWFQPYPEGSGVVRFRTTPSDSTANTSLDVTAGFKAFVAELGWPLPEPLPQPRACQQGVKNYTVVIVLDSGQQQFYGPCTRPARVEQAAARLNTGYP